MTHSVHQFIVDPVPSHPATNSRPLRLRRGSKLARPQLIKLYKRFLRFEDFRIRRSHEQGASGLEVCSARSDLLDRVLRDILCSVLESPDIDAEGKLPFALIATGGYGRGLLNPGSDLDLLFLLPRGVDQPDQNAAAIIEDILYLLWDVGFEVGHAVRGVRANIQQATENPVTKCSFIEMRLIAGASSNFERLVKTFRHDVILKHEAEFLDERRADLASRQAKSSDTVFLQEPNVKLSLGGLRDHHLMRWICWVKRGTLDLEVLVKEGLLSPLALGEVDAAHDFLLRVRNELHYQGGRPNDILTLRLQGVVAARIGYPQRSQLRRIEAFMRDYYRHAQRLLQHSSSLLESFEIEEARRPHSVLHALIPGLGNKTTEEVHFDGFIARDGRIHAESPLIFSQEPHRLMRVFQHAQLRGLHIAPELKSLIRDNLHRIDRPFRYHKAIRQTFEAILSRKGSVARSLRQMQRVDFLGQYLPEFGKLDCLVQHEFFHRYTADEHTLRTIDWLDTLIDSDRPQDQFYRQLFRKIEDPPLFYIALLLHDSGRAEDMRQHEDGSAMLASKVSTRLGIHGARRRYLMFLVVHHLTLFRTATTRNVDDPQVVREFATIVASRKRLDSLMLFSWADTHGTADDAWSGWKEAMLRHLYRNTILWWETSEEAFRPSYDELKNKVRAALPSSYGAEIEAHFRGMAADYFTLRGPSSIVRHIRLYRTFFTSQQPRRGIPQALAPALLWHDVPEAGWTVLTVCTWDRARLLTRIAAALTRRRINILSAELHTRADDTVLNTFRICTMIHEPVSRELQRRQVEEDLSRLLGIDPLDPDQLLASARLNPPAGTEERLGHGIPARVILSNEEDPRYTGIHIQSVDRIGLLFEIFRVIGNHDLDVVHARITTEKGAAIDTIQVNDARDKPLTDPIRLAQLRRDLEEIVGVADSESPSVGGEGQVSGEGGSGQD